MEKSILLIEYSLISIFIHHFLKYKNYLLEEGEILKNSEKIILKFIQLLKITLENNIWN